jgi:hypothetical protein
VCKNQRFSKIYSYDFFASSTLILKALKDIPYDHSVKLSQDFLSKKTRDNPCDKIDCGKTKTQKEMSFVKKHNL